MQAAIRSLTHVKFTFPYSIHSKTAEPMTLLLSQIAPMCPALQKLQITGEFSRGLLVAFGESCINLSYLKLVTGSSESLQQLSLVMPHLTHCSYRVPHTEPLVGSYDGDAVEYFRLEEVLETAEPCCVALFSCATITHMDIGFIALSDGIWDALPEALQSLRCSVDGFGVCNASLKAEKLQQLEICCIDGYETSLRELVQILSLAPAVKGLNLLGWDQDKAGCWHVTNDAHLFIDVDLTSQGILDLVFLHDRVLAGLSVTAEDLEGRIVAGVSLFMARYELGNTDDLLKEFMAKLPPFPAFCGLKVCCPPRDPSTQAPSITKLITAAFPGLTSLRIIDHVIQDRDLLHLKECAALQYLRLPSAGVSSAALEDLCTRLNSLEVLRLRGHHSRDVPVNYGAALQRTLREGGSNVKIMTD